jgi:xanthine dehydrogenase accessory factor
VADLAAFLRRAGPCVQVAVRRAEGSTPRDTDAWMLVSRGEIFGTIGGGQLEFMAIGQARAQLAAGDAAREMTVALGPAIGQCCGGRVALALRAVDKALCEALIAGEDARIRARPLVMVFGAGHVGRALARALVPLPVRAVLVDTREAALADAPGGCETRLSALPEAEARAASPGSAFVILTHDHALDFLIAREALARRDAAYVGLIGSATKRATFGRWLRREGGDAAGMSRLTCPIGGQGPRDKRPAVIAAFTAAEVMAALIGESAATKAAESTPH